jgi:hypothetical protein
VTHEEITNIVAAFRSNTALGFDKIPMWLLKRSIHLICQPLTCIINISINTGIVPEGLNIARVAPLFQSGENNLITNYRPISILSVFSKMFERVVYNQTFTKLFLFKQYFVEKSIWFSKKKLLYLIGFTSNFR